MDYSPESCSYESIDVDADEDSDNNCRNVKPEDLSSLLKSMNERKGIKTNMFCMYSC